MQDRIIEIQKKLNLSATMFASEIGVQRSSISHILSGRNKPSFDFITKILERYPEINPEWLIMGRGSIFKGHTDSKSENLSKNDKDLFNSTGIKNRIEEVKDEDDIKYERRNDRMALVTNVNSGKVLQKVILLYQDGSFDEYYNR
jgi:transcriptional regulator with XRE-family HTH domain